MDNPKTTLLITTLLPVLLCCGETFPECMQRATQADKGGREIREMCIIEHEKELSLSAIKYLKARGSIKPKGRDADNTYEFSAKLKNLLDDTLVTQVSYRVTITQDGEEYVSMLTGREVVMPIGIGDFYGFDNIFDEIRLPRRFDRDEDDEWVFRITGARGIKLKSWGLRNVF